MEDEKRARSKVDEQSFSMSPQSVDAVNTEFYGQIKYPWPPMVLERALEADVWTTFLSQDIGDWSGARLPSDLRIWVAGCGTNQALITALKFPAATVTGTDLSVESLAVCERNARQLGVRNLTLRQQSIHASTTRAAFDYIICTGVIHHNADPADTLAKLASALTPSGVMELMVYNRYHRTLPLAFQSAVRTLLQHDQPDLPSELDVAKKLVRSFPGENAMADFLRGQTKVPDAAFADMLLQPVEHVFTVKSLQRLAASCGLELLAPCVDAFSRSDGHIDWNIVLGDPDLQHVYAALPDEDRWQVTNLLMGEASPWLWFYLQRQDSPHRRQTEDEFCRGFLDTCFARNSARQELWTITKGGSYERSRDPVPVVRGRPKAAAERVYDELDESVPIRKTVTRLQCAGSLAEVNALRIRLATSGFPFLRRHAWQQS